MKIKTYVLFAKKTLRQVAKTVGNKPVFAHLRALVAGFVLTKESKKLRSLEELIDFAYRFKVLGVKIRPMQVPWEIKKLLTIIEEAKIEIMLEIGTANGGTLFLFKQVADPRAMILSMDLPGGPFGGGYPSWKSTLYKRFEKHGQRLYLIRGDSHNQQILNNVKSILNGEMLGFLFVDGDHTYKGVKMDFEMYAPLMKDGGIIAFHDIVPGPAERVGGVPRFWQEIKTKYMNLEIVKNQNQEGCGIGIIFWKSARKWEKIRKTRKKQRIKQKKENSKEGQKEQVRNLR